MVESILVSECETFWAEICIAGDVNDARRACREFCEEGLCVTIDPTDYIYTGGNQTGVRVRLINYPRFPSSPNSILGKAERLAQLLQARLFQDSYTIVTPLRSYFYTRRSDD